MTEKRYYKKEYEEEYYIFDSNTLTEKEFEKKIEYDGYTVFADSLTSKEILDLLNENEELKEDKYAYLGEITLYKREAYKRKKENGQLKKENEQLKQALRDSYINEICENCKYGNYFLSDNFDGGFEGDFECLKKHFGNAHWECDGLTECDEFELEIKGDEV